MLDPTKNTHSPLLWSNEHLDKRFSTLQPAKEDLHAAEEQAASLYYLTTLKSLAASQNLPEKDKVVLSTEKKAAEKSLLGRTKDWLWGIFGWGQKQPVSEKEVENLENLDHIQLEDSFAGGAPRLQSPETKDQKRLAQAITDLNRELVSRLKDMAEFEEEMRKSSSSKLDKLIFFHLVNSSINQKKLKESISLIHYDELMGLHKKNKDLHKAHFALVDAIHSENKARNVIKWINVGLTAVSVGGAAIGFALGGPIGIVAVGVPLSLIGRGSTLLTDGILKYRNDKKTGELVIIKQETKTNSSQMNENLSDMQTTDGDIATLLKMVRQHLDNQTKAERAAFGRTS